MIYTFIWCFQNFIKLLRMPYKISINFFFSKIFYTIGYMFCRSFLVFLKFSIRFRNILQVQISLFFFDNFTKFLVVFLQVSKTFKNALQNFFVMSRNFFTFFRYSYIFQRFQTSRMVLKFLGILNVLYGIIQKIVISLVISKYLFLHLKNFWKFLKVS